MPLWTEGLSEQFNYLKVGDDGINLVGKFAGTT